MARTPVTRIPTTKQLTVKLDTISPALQQKVSLAGGEAVRVRLAA